MKSKIILSGKETKASLHGLLMKHKAVYDDKPYQDVVVWERNTKDGLLSLVKRFNVNIANGGNGNVNKYADEEINARQYYELQDYFIEKAKEYNIALDEYNHISCSNRLIKDFIKNIMSPQWKEWVAVDCKGLIGPDDVDGGKMLINGMYKKLANEIMQTV